MIKNMAPTLMRSCRLLLRALPWIILSLEPTVLSQAPLCLPSLPVPMPPRNPTLTHQGPLDCLTPNSRRMPTRAALFRSGIGSVSSIVALGGSISPCSFSSSLLKNERRRNDFHHGDCQDILHCVLRCATTTANQFLQLRSQLPNIINITPGYHITFLARLLIQVDESGANKFCRVLRET